MPTNNLLKAPMSRSPASFAARLLLFTFSIALAVSHAAPSISLDTVLKEGSVAIRQADLASLEIAGFKEIPGNRGSVPLQEYLFSNPPPNTAFFPVIQADAKEVKYLDFNPLVKGSTGWHMVRAKLIIRADRKDSVALISDGRAFYKVSCNGIDSEVLGSTQWLEKYGHATRLDLEAGDNVVSVTLVGSNGQFTLALSLYEMGLGRAAASENGISTALLQYVYQSTESIRVDDDSLWAGKNANAVLSGNPESLKGEIAAMGWALRRVEFNAGAVHHSETVSFIDPAKVQSSILDATTQKGLSADRQSELALLGARITNLLDPSKRFRDRMAGERDLVDSLQEFERMRSLIGEPSVDWHHAPGLHWATFYSAAKKDWWPYLIYLPRGHNKDAKLPLLVVVPSAAPNKDHFYDSWIVNRRDLNHSYIAAAEQNNFAVIWPWGGNIEHSSVTESLVEETIGAATNRFAFDASGVSLIGACGAARDALLHGARKPDLGVFAVVAHTPSTTLLRESPRTGDLIRSSPLHHITELSSLRLLFSHGAHDRHMPLGATLALAQAIKARGGNPSLSVIDGADEAYFPGRNNQWIADGSSRIKMLIDARSK